MEVPVAAMQPGELIRVLWRGKLVFVLRRSEEMLERLPENLDNLRDPNSEITEQQPSYAPGRAHDARCTRRRATCT